MASQTQPNDPFAPELHPGAPQHPPGIGFGDLVHTVASPVARLIDTIAGTSIEKCSGCASRRAKWNGIRIPFTTNMKLSSHRHITQSAVPLQKWFANHPPEAHRPKPPRPWRMMEPLHERAIIMPWLSSGPEWELRHSLRSIDAFFSDKECPIYLLCDRRPAWLRANERIRIMEMPGYSKSNEEGLREAWEFGCQVAAQIAWWNDDIYLLRPTGWDDLRVALTEGDLEMAADELRSSGNGWRRSMGAAVEDLKLHGFSGILRFATHTPYLFEAEKAREIASTYHLPFSGAFETLYHNHHGTPHEPVGRHRTDTLPCGHNPRYLNHGRYGPNESSRAEIEKLFPNPSPWEVALTKSAPAILSGAIPALVSMATFPPRIAGLERVVSDILPQCDGLRIYLNGYDSIPDFMPDDAKLELVLAGTNSPHPDLGSHGKWHWLGREDCHHLTVDDDIFYADGYVRHMIDACKRLGDRAIVGLHGYRFRFLQRGALMPTIPVARMRHMRSYSHALDDDWTVHVLGSGVMCCRPSVIGLTPDALGGALHSGDDEDLALWAQTKKIPMIRVASPGALALANNTEWKKEALCRRPEFKEISEIKLRSHTKWTLHTL